MGGGDQMKVFQFRHIRKKFTNDQGIGHIVLEDVGFSVTEGSITSIVGPSGCGKTTFLRIIAGFDADFSGTVTVDSGGRAETPLQVGATGYIPQEPSLFPWCTVEENIAFGLRIRNMPVLERQRRLDELLQIVHLEQYRRYYPKEISGGMKQKATICRALAYPSEYGLLLMDEPFSALDAQTRNALQRDLLIIQQSQNLTVLFVTHNMDEAVFISDQVVVLSPLPATVKVIVPINLAHPRDRTSARFNAIRKDLINKGEFGG